MNQRRIYQSSNGDSWWLCRSETGQAFVLHEANIPAGGKTTEIEIRDFLSAETSAPEHEALLRMIGELASVEG